MSFEDEWTNLRSNAAMRLAGASSGPSGGHGGVSSSEAKKKAAVRALEEHVLPDTQAAGKVMDETTEAAVKGFKDWATGAGLTTALKGWRTSVGGLQKVLAGEKTALSGTNQLLHGGDRWTGGQFDGLTQPPAGGQPQPPFLSKLQNYH
ncbi:hypothetical protein GCM10010218_64680 [Streptomyces mashuensis]|uniref:Uncharacterized protein n=1 Tax=Streptomyces mashuensis TaxID=33904 RepID=A0A919BB01_9ACTN|nr:hypothetical protein [Streptomyces mashuensis]GHF74685.1 hypothetical protein GCM10010218_64680 [Streptomyces mashuensis]